ncbi:MAG: hypothetical protein ACRD1E_04345, partial [Terriglobales bacterium]
TTNILLLVFIAIAAAAMVIQLVVFAGIARRLAALSEKVVPILPQVEQSARALPGLMRDLQAMVGETRPKLQTLAANLAEISTLARDQVRRADAFATDFTERAELQMVRVDEALSVAIASFEQITTSVRDSVLRPVQDAHALFHGLRTGLDFFFRRRSNPALNARPLYQDEEMFI